MIYDERQERRVLILNAARQMMAAARTAPKGKGIDIIEIAVITDEDIKRLSDKLYELAEETGHAFMHRDAGNLMHADAVMLVGTRRHPQGLDCAYCGFQTCGEKPVDTPCALNAMDLGIALGSAVAMAADLRIDTRVMFSAGLAAQRLDLLDDCRMVMAVPMSISSKSPFFDR